MNFQPAASKALNKSRVCFYIVLNEEGVINFANDYFRNSFSIETLPFNSIYNLADPQQVECLSRTINEVLSNPEPQKAIDLNLHQPGGNYITVRWDITTNKDDVQTFIECIGIPMSAEKTAGEKVNLLVPHISSSDNNAPDDKMNRVLESISDGFLTVNRDWNILYWNRQAEQLLGFQRKDVLGKNLWTLFKNAVPRKLYREYHNAFKNNKSVHFEEYFEQSNRWFEISAYPYEEILSVFFKNITEKKKTEETVRLSGERYEVLAKATKDAIWDWNLTTGKVIWNEGLKTIFNHHGIEEVEESDWWARNLHPEDKERVIIKIRKHINERLPNWQDEYRFRCADGSFKYVFDRGFTIYDNNELPVRMIGSMQDLTETKANELILKDLNKSLEKRAAELATSNEELERFAYVASHDLQEPLRMVSSFLQLIEKKYQDKLDQKGHEYISFAVDGAERMKGLILDLLEYSRVNSRKTEKEAVDLNEIAQSILVTYNPAIEQANGKIVVDKLPVVMGNKVQLMQLFQNLVGNALKYKSDLPPEIFVRVKENESNYEFLIADNGIGIESRFFKKIFVIFQRLHNKAEYSGTGIGLAICKKIIELHAGNIWVESAPGNGSTFFFTLPKTIVTAV